MKIRIQLLGEFRLSAGQRAVSDACRERRLLDLLKLLALTPGHELAREQVVEALWPHLEPTAAFANLHRAASAARSALDSAEAIVLRNGHALLFPNAQISTDLEEFEQRAHRALSGGDARACAAVAADYHGGVLPADPYAEWAEPARSRARRLYVELLQAAGQWQALLELEPDNEHAHHELLRQLCAQGRRQAAREETRRHRGALASLGLRPSAATLATWRALSLCQDIDAAGTADSDLLGRRDALASATAVLEQVESGIGATLLVTGEAGIGKTRFCEALLASARARGWLTTFGSASRAEGELPWSPVVEAVSRLTAQRPELVEALPPATRAGLARLWGQGGPSFADSGLRGRQPILAGVCALLRRAALEHAALLWIDDIHEADEATVHLARYLSHRARNEHLLVLLSMRTEGRGAAGGRLRAELLAETGVTELELPPLSLQDTRALVHKIAGREVSESTARTIYDRAAGNPFFTEELARALEPNGSLRLRARTYEIIQARAGSLQEDVRSVLQQAAVLGSEFALEELEALVGFDEAAASAIIDRALAAGVIVEAGERYRFRHGLFRESLLALLPSHRRRATAQRAAEVLASRGGAPGRVARLLLAGGAGAQAVPWLERAAREAAALGAVAHARTLVERALEHAPNQPSLLELHADCLFATGEPDALAAYGKAISAARGARRRRLRIRLARVAIALGDTGTAAQALECLEGRGAMETVGLHIARGYLSLSLGDLAGARRHATAARQVALNHGLVGELADAATLAALTAHSEGAWQDQIELDVLDTARAPQLAASVHDGHLCVVEHWLYGDQPYERVIAFANRLRQTARINGAERGEAFATLLLGEAELLGGQLQSAFPHLREAARLHRRVLSAAGESLALQRLAEAHLLVGRPDAAEPLLRHALDLARGSSLLVRHLLPRIYGTMVRAARQPDEALEVIAEAQTATAEARDLCRTCSIAFLLPAAIAYAQAGDVERAAAHVAAAKQVSTPVWQARAWTAAIAEAEAAVAAAAGDRARSAECLRTAVDLFRAAGQPTDAARCQEACSRMANGGAALVRSG